MRNLMVLLLLLAGCGGDAVAPLTFNDLSPSANADLSHPDAGTNPSPSPSTGCGTCPTGTSCGSANGIAVCKTAGNVPLFEHVFVIVMENTSLASLQKSTTTPYLQGLMQTAAWSADYHGVTHPSLPNYIALTSGSPGVQMDGTSDVSCDCDPEGKTCNMCSTLSTLLTKCGCAQPAQHIGDQLEAAGKNWKNYGQSMGTACNLTSNGAYAARHLPFLYYDNVQTNSTRCGQHVVDYSSFAADLANAPSLVFIAPDLDHDMHGTGLLQGAADITAGDSWLASNIPTITSSAAYKSGGVIFIVWDEDDLSGTLAKDDPIPMLVLSPYAKTGGYSSMTHGDHYALLATMEDGLRLSRLGGAQGASTLGDLFADK
jgi:hypothetical protein